MTKETWLFEGAGKVWIRFDLARIFQDCGGIVRVIGVFHDKAGWVIKVRIGSCIPACVQRNLHLLHCFKSCVEEPQQWHL